MTGSRSGRTVQLAVAPALAAGVFTVTRLVRRRAAGASSHTGGHTWVVTVALPADQVLSDGRPPAPLARFGDAVTVSTRPPADPGKGTELVVTVNRPGKASAGDVRAALRQAKQLLETGEVLRNDPVSHGRRKPTPSGLLLEAATRRAPKEGVL